MGAIVKHNFPNITNSFFDGWQTETVTETEQTRNNKELPDVQVEKADTGYRVLLQLPGANKETLKVKVEDGYLKISGDYIKLEKEGYEVVRRDFRNYENFERWLNIDESKFELDAVQAELQNGILSVELPLRAEEQRKQVEIQVK